ncbi:UDP-N-acetyl-D-glucosamine dehydrogenase [Terrabacter sp. 28]|nr:UDP-N-acetyl-D-glucosamine dehydrogenase [Terrabacter sp. 28]
MSLKVGIIGQGYVGLPLAVRAAEVGLSVIGFDVHSGLVEQLNQGRSHVDDISDETLNLAISQGYEATDDPQALSNADVIVVCVPTPLSSDGGPDLTYIESAARTIARVASPGTTVILESTTYPGTTEEIFAPLVTAGGLMLDVDVFIAFSPERVDPGNPTYGIRNTPKVVGGLTTQSTQRAAAFYERFIDEVVIARGAAEAEMAKILENTFRHVNIALMNEMVRFCDDLGIDLWNAIDCAATKPFGYMPFRPGPGVGGHCIPVDPSYLSHRVKAQLGYAFRMVELAEEINEAAPTYVARRAWRILNNQERAVNGSTVLLLGVTYKPDIADCRESPADQVARTLADWGANVRYCDPFVPNWLPQGWKGQTLKSETSITEGARGADIVVLLQNHSAFDLQELASTNVAVLDTRNVLSGFDNVEML